MQLGEQIIYKNNQLIGVNKPAGISVQEDNSSDEYLGKAVEKYCHHPIHIIHRIDRPTSGVVIFAKNKKSLAHLNRQMKERTTKKTYLAIVKNKPEKAEGTLEHYLLKDHKRNKSYAVNEDRKGSKKAILHYRVLAKSDHLFLLQIELVTGRHHQIRAQLAAVGNPIRGDVKYGFKRANRNKSINLHAWKLDFDHPVTNSREKLVANLPDFPEWKAFDLTDKT